MKIVITSPSNTPAKELEAFSSIAQYLKRLGHNVYDLNSKTKTTKDAMIKNFTASEKKIKDADILICEISSADAKVGYEVARALDEKKVVITLEQDKSKTALEVIHGNTTRQIVSRKYNTKNITQVLDEALKEAESKLDSKFILIISPEMDRYLNWASKTKRTHKAQLVRSALEVMIKKDRDYKGYVEGE